MDKARELVWIDSELLPKWDLLQDILRLNGKGLEDVLESLKQDDLVIEENLEENLIGIKHHAKKVRDVYKECVDEQIEKTEKLWEECDGKINQARSNLNPIKNMIRDIDEDMRKLHTTMDNLPIRQLEKSLDVLERFNNMCDMDKKKIKMLFDLDKE